MPFAAALSTIPHTRRALDEVCSRLGDDLAGAPDLAFVFFSTHHAGAAEDLVRKVHGVAKVAQLDSDEVG